MPQLGSQWFLYVLECSDGSLYSGVTIDVDRRYGQHVAGKGARYTRSRPPKQLLGYRACVSKSAAFKDEIAIKKLRPSEKRTLVASWTSVCTVVEH